MNWDDFIEPEGTRIFLPITATRAILLNHKPSEYYRIPRVIKRYLNYGWLANSYNKRMIARGNLMKGATIFIVTTIAGEGPKQLGPLHTSEAACTYVLKLHLWDKYRENYKDTFATRSFWNNDIYFCGRGPSESLVPNFVILDDIIVRLRMSLCIKMSLYSHFTEPVAKVGSIIGIVELKAGLGGKQIAICTMGEGIDYLITMWCHTAEMWRPYCPR